MTATRPLPMVAAGPPRTRADCIAGPRPCPWTTCRYHLDVERLPPRGRPATRLRPAVAHESRETCALDVADRGGLTLEEVGHVLGVSRERTRQILEAAITRILGHRPEHGSTSLYESRRLAPPAPESDDLPDEEDREERPLEWLARHFGEEGQDDGWCARVWRAYTRGDVPDETTRADHPTEEERRMPDDISIRDKTPACDYPTRPEELDDWAIVQSGTLGYLAQLPVRPDGEYLVVAKAYGWLFTAAVTPEGHVQQQKAVLPLLMLSGARRLTIRPDTILPLDQLGRGERLAILDMIRGAEGIREQLAMRAVGLVAPTEVARVAR